MTKNLYCFVGKSGSGKDTIVNYLCQNYGYKKVFSNTTRPQRLDDPKDKYSHTFLTVEDYEREKANGLIVADTFYDENYYWTRADMLEDVEFYIIDLAGLRSLKQNYTDRPIKAIFVGADEKVRRRRMTLRGDTNKQICDRLKNDKEMFADMKREDFDVWCSNNGVFSVEAICEGLNKMIEQSEEETTKC